MNRFFTKYGKLIAITTFALTLLGLLIVILLLQTNRIGGNESLNDDTNDEIASYISYPVSSSSIDLEYKNQIVINGIKTGVYTNPDLAYQQSTVVFEQENQCGADSGFESIYFPDLGYSYMSMHLLNRKHMGDDKFNQYYAKFDTKEYKNKRNQFIVYPFCGGAIYINSFSYIFEEGFTPLTVNIAVGPYQYVPATKEFVNISAAAFTYNQNNLVQINFHLSELFKFEDVQDYVACTTSESNPVSYSTHMGELIYDLGCFAKLVGNDQEKANIIKTEINSVLSEIDLDLE